ncbi:hypothetical protein GJ496_010585 [Pomphorhynchus laevis]|nr:hypothetical protein GJ496_010585 [Pomphorhynchus laevis]
MDSATPIKVLRKKNLPPCPIKAEIFRALQNWRIEAKSKCNKKLDCTLKEAIQSLKKYPLPLSCVAECRQLKGFGERIVERMKNEINETNLPLKSKTNDKCCNDKISIAVKNKLTLGAKQRNPSTLNGPRKRLAENRIVTAETVSNPVKSGVQLIVDSHEVNKPCQQSLIKRLKCKYMIRPLSIGDFLWALDDERVLMDTAIERKTYADLAKSMRDNRWTEQKHRLNRCPLRRRIILVEGKRSANEPDCIDQAIVNAEILDNMNIMFCLNKSRDTANILNKFTTQFQLRYDSRSDSEKDRDNTVETQSLTEFNEHFIRKASDMTAKEMLARCLLHVHGVSSTKCANIIKQCSTVQQLLLRTQVCSKKISKDEITIRSIIGFFKYCPSTNRSS